MSPTIEALLKEVAATPTAQAVAEAGAALVPGAAVGKRYEIVRQLGKGGMGAVYLAHDRELSRLVALKVIAPHLASEQWVVDRFKREIQLSSIVTHPNVLRVFDLSEAEGLRFLTMQYVEGDTLAGLMRKHRPLPIEWSLSLFRQIGAGLQAAHEKGVLHRDLKPQNVLVDGDRRGYLTDFGLATSASLSTLTQTGTLLGTPHYMSPEQVKGQPADVRSDVFSIGVMLFEMLAGELPYSGDSVYAVMMARTRPPVKSASEINPDVPRRLQALLDRCMAIEPSDRYGSVAEVLSDLDASTVPAPAPRPAARRTGVSGRKALALAAAALLSALVPYLAWRLWPVSAPASQATRTVLIGDFDNRTGEDVFSGTLEPAFGLALEGAAFVASFSRGSALKVAEQLKLEGSGLPERRARLVAQREGIPVVTSGFVERNGPGYRVGIRAVDAFTGQRIVEEAVECADRAATLAAATKLAARVRGALGDVTPEAVQLKEGETFSAASLEAAHSYARASDLASSQGKYDEARGHYLEAIRLDPAMGRAYSGLAVIEANRGHGAEAERWFRLAIANDFRMSDREKLRTRGLWFARVRDMDKAAESFSTLVQRYPADTAGLSNLALVHSLRGEFRKALELARRSVELLPRSVPQRSNVGYFALYAGQFDEAIAEQKRALELNGSFVAAHVGLALAHEAAENRGEAVAAWDRLRALGPAQADVAVEGLADLAAAEGRLADVRALLREPPRGGDADAASRRLLILSHAHLRRGEDGRAAEAAEQALLGKPPDHVALMAGLALAEAGREKRAQALARSFDHRAEGELRAYGDLLRGTLLLRRKRPAEAVAALRDALQKRDLWLVRLALARAYLEAGQAAQAADELDTCERRRGEATDMFVESVPTWRFYPATRFYQARARELLRSPASAEAYRAFLALKKGDEELEVADARKRLAALEGK